MGKTLRPKIQIFDLEEAKFEETTKKWNFLNIKTYPTDDPNQRNFYYFGELSAVGIFKQPS